MADKKVDALQSATTPLAGTEELHVVQGGNSRKTTTGSFYIPGGTDIAITDGGTGASDASGARTNLGLAIGSDVQAYNAGLADIAGLAKTDGNIIVGNGTNWVAESGATARASLGLAIGTDVQAYNSNLADISALTTTAYGRSFLTYADEAAFKAGVNLEIGVDVQAYDASLADIAGLTLTAGDVFYYNGTNIVNLGIGAEGEVLKSVSGLPAWGAAAGGGDMLASTYDPQNIAADAFDVDNHTDGTTNKVYTATEQSKLAGIETGADVTDAANVAAAGAVMEADTSTASMQFVIDEDDMASDSATKVPTQQSVKAYADTKLASVVAGDNVTVDNTDPQNPIISADGGGAIDLRVSNLLLAEFTGKPIFLGPGGSALHDPFNTLEYVDVAEATNLDTSEAGVLKPTMASGGTDSAATPSGASTFTINSTFFDRTVVLDNDKTVQKFGVYSSDARAMWIKICHRVSTTQVDIVRSQQVSHPGGGWVDFDLDVPYVVPATGTYLPGIFSNNGNPIVCDPATDRIAGFGAGVNAVGTGITTVENNGNMPATRVTYAGVLNNVLVASEPVAASAQPTSIAVVAFLSGSVIINSNTVIAASRDGGTTWGNITMEHLYDQPDGVKVYYGVRDVTGQPAGSTVQWRLATSGGANVKLRAVALWGNS